MIQQDQNHTIVTTQSVQLFSGNNPLHMDCGALLAPVSVAYETYGSLNAAADNVILICHALTGSAHAGGFSSSDIKSAGWWEPMIGPGRAFDTDKYFIVSSNFLGGCYGTTGPVSINPKTEKRYGPDFPQMTIRDMVRVQKVLLDYLGAKRLRTISGGSLGGMQVLEWGAMYPEMIDSLIPIATASSHSPWCIGLNAIARQAIMTDPNWKNGRYDPEQQPDRGLALARQVAMVSYRSDISFLNRFKRNRLRAGEIFDEKNLFQVENYLLYQGEKLVHRFDANTYVYISRAMDLHDLGGGRGSVGDVLGAMTMPVLSVGINSDILYPAREQKTICSQLRNASYCEIDSPHGHDAFLIEYDQLTKSVQDFLMRNNL